MPTISIKREQLHRALDKEYTEEEFSDLCFDFGLELDDVVEETQETGDGKKEVSVVYKIEIPANRYDLLCLEGLSRALLIFLGKKKNPLYTKVTPETGIQKLVVRSSTDSIRPYCVAAVLRGINFTPQIYQSFIDLQDKLHQNICRKRSLVAIGTHDLDTIKGPFSYEALKPHDIKFTPLNQTKEYTAAELMDLYVTDSHLKPYLPIIRDKPRYPVIYDSNRVVLSMPPIINGEHSKITLNTKNVFIESTATDLTKAVTVLDILVCMFSEYCTEEYVVEPVEVSNYNGDTVLYPALNYRQHKLHADYVNSLLGTQLKPTKIASLLRKMSLESKVKDTVLDVTVPPTRQDIMHACDLIEDVAVAYGYNNIAMTMPKAFTISSQVPLNKLCDQLREQIAQAGFTEALTFSLCSKEDISTKLRRTNIDDAVVIANPKTQDFQVARTSLLPGLLKTLSCNKMMPLPVKLFEVGDVVVKCSTKDVGARNESRLCAVIYGKAPGFAVIHGLLDRVMQVLQVPFKTEDGYSLSASENGSYFPQCADVRYKGDIIGQVGGLHPDVISNFDLTLASGAAMGAAMEINLHPFL